MSYPFLLRLDVKQYPALPSSWTTNNCFYFYPPKKEKKIFGREIFTTNKGISWPNEFPYTGLLDIVWKAHLKFVRFVFLYGLNFFFYLRFKYVFCSYKIIDFYFSFP
jgi:hypothetical protein